MSAAPLAPTNATSAEHSSRELICQGAAELARGIAAGRWTASEVVEAHLARIEQVNGKLNALVVPLFDEARREARLADEAQRRGNPLGPLHGVPVTIKESFHVAGTPSTIGLTHRRERIERDGPLVHQLRRAGAIVLGKTNLPQLMIWHESVNPVYGRTNNPWDLSRTAGGSTGGEAALLAAGGSPLGLGSDLGGSIRVPSHFCGIQGLKPTSRRLAKSGQTKNLLGFEAIQCQAGPMARRVEDLELTLRVLCDAPPGSLDPEATPGLPLPSCEVDLARLRIGMWMDDGYFPVSPSVRRAVEEAAEVLRSRGATVESFQPPDVGQAVDLYFGVTGADRGAGLRRLLSGSEIDPSVRKLMLLARVPNLLRGAVSAGFRLFGQEHVARLLEAVRYGSTDYSRRLTHRRQMFAEEFVAKMTAEGFDALLTPPHALAAMKHGNGVELLGAAASALVFNVTGMPAGVVAATRVRSGEESDRSASRDLVVRRALHCEVGSAGLPVGVQVAARHWREDVVLAIMQALEEAFSSRPDYPAGVKSVA